MRTEQPTHVFDDHFKFYRHIREVKFDPRITNSFKDFLIDNSVARRTDGYKANITGSGYQVEAELSHPATLRKGGEQLAKIQITRKAEPDAFEADRVGAFIVKRSLDHKVMENSPSTQFRPLRIIDFILDDLFRKEQSLGEFEKIADYREVLHQADSTSKSA